MSVDTADVSRWVEHEQVDEPRPRTRSFAADTVLFAAVLVGRVVFLWSRQIFTITADEPATLAMSRWLSGSGRWSMFGFSTWQPGLAIVAAPIHLVVDDRTQLLRSILVLNAVISAIAALVLVRVLRRLVDAPSTFVYFAAAAVALAPMSMVSSTFVWAEPLVTLSFLTSLVWLMRFYEGHRLVDGAAAIAFAAGGWLSHGRLLMLFGIVVVLVLGRALATREREQAIVLAGVATLSYAMCTAIASVVTAQVWDTPARTNSVRGIGARFFDVPGAATSLLGQVWYQLVATCGVVVIGVVAVVRAGAHDPEHPNRSVDARLLGACVIPQVALSVVFMIDRTRVDHDIYGRYNDAILWPVLALGLITMLDSRHLRRPFGHELRLTGIIVLGLVITALGVVATNARTLSEGGIARSMIPGVAAFDPRGDGIDVLAVTMAAACVVIAITAAWLSRRAWILAAVLVVLAVVGGLRVHDALATDKDANLQSAGVAALTNSILAPGETVGFRIDPRSSVVTFQAQALQQHLYQWFLPEVEITRDRGADDSVGPHVFAATDDPSLIAQGATVVWEDPHVAMALWREP